jgi:hypothetical protein
VCYIAIVQPVRRRRVFGNILCCCIIESTTFCSSFPTESFVISRTCSFEDAAQYSCFMVCWRCSCNPLYHFRRFNWIGTHWRGTRRRSPVKGVNSVNKFSICDSLSCCVFHSVRVFILLLSSCCFSITFSYYSRYLHVKCFVYMLSIRMSFKSTKS